MKRYGQYGRKASWKIVKSKIWKIWKKVKVELWNDMENMDGGKNSEKIWNMEENMNIENMEGKVEKWKDMENMEERQIE